jgi:hypothetical protein
MSSLASDLNFLLRILSIVGIVITIGRSVIQDLPPFSVTLYPGELIGIFVAIILITLVMQYGMQDK